jgi:hypothetical protein
MAVTWSVVSLDSTKTVGSLSDVVTTVHWTASDSETVGEDTYTGSSYGSVALAEVLLLKLLKLRHQLHPLEYLGKISHFKLDISKLVI